MFNRRVRIVFLILYVIIIRRHCNHFFRCQSTGVKYTSDKRWFERTAAPLVFDDTVEDTPGIADTLAVKEAVDAT